MKNTNKILPLVVAATLLTLPASADAVGRYVDRTGDSGAAPDITGVTVSSDAAGQVAFVIGVDRLPTPSDVRTLLVIDTDANADTGAPAFLGAEYIFVVDESDQTYGFARWTGFDWDWETPYSTVRVYVRPTGVSIGVNQRELGDTERLNFWVRTRKGEIADEQFDDAPDDGTWNFSLAAGGPEIQGVTVSTTPSFGPRAGRPFVLKPLGLRLPPSGAIISALPPPETYGCRATLAGRLLTGRGTGGCAWAVPKTARGKRLLVTLTVGYQGATASFRFPYRVA